MQGKKHPYEKRAKGELRLLISALRFRKQGWKTFLWKMRSKIVCLGTASWKNKRKRHRGGQTQRMWQRRKLHGTSGSSNWYWLWIYSISASPDTASLSWFERYHKQQNPRELEMEQHRTLSVISFILQRSDSATNIHKPKQNKPGVTVRWAFLDCDLIKLFLPHMSKSSKTTESKFNVQSMPSYVF